MKIQSQRQLQVGEKIKRKLSGVWSSFDSILPRISIIEVQISPDLKNATIFYMPPKDADSLELQHKLNNSVKHIRYELAQLLTNRVTPRLKFIEDKVQKNAEHIEQLLKESGDV